MSLKIDIDQRRKGVYSVMLIGRLDADTYESFRSNISTILLKTTKVLVLDMAKLVYISSIGLNEIFNAKKAVVKYGGSLIITNLQPQIKKIFEVIKILPKDIVFENTKDVDRYLDDVQKREIKKSPSADSRSNE